MVNKKQITRNLIYIGGVSLGILSTSLIANNKVEASEWKANSTSQIITEMNKQKGEQEILAVYEIQFGDTLSGIANASNLTIDQIVKMNNIINPNLIYVGDKINLGMSKQAKQYVVSRGQSNIENAKNYDLPTNDEAIQTILKTNNNKQTLNTQDRMSTPKSSESTIGNNNDSFNLASGKIDGHKDTHNEGSSKNNSSIKKSNVSKSSEIKTSSTQNIVSSSITQNSSENSSSKEENKPTVSSSSKKEEQTATSSSSVNNKPTITSSSSKVVTVNSSVIQKPMTSSSSSNVINKTTVSSSSSVQKPVVTSSSSSSSVQKPVIPSTSSSSSVANKPVTPPTSSSKPVTPSKPSVNYTYNDLFNGVVSTLKATTPSANQIQFRHDLALGTNQGFDSEWRNGWSSDQPKTYQVNVYLSDNMTDEQKFNRVCNVLAREYNNNTAYSMGYPGQDNNYAYIKIVPTGHNGNTYTFNMTSVMWSCLSEKAQEGNIGFEGDNNHGFEQGDVTWS